MPETKADDILRRAAQHMEDRAKTYDAAGGERSMGKVADIIRTLYAEQLERGEFTEEMAWGLQVVLKLVRSSQGGHRADNYEDGAAYFALWGSVQQSHVVKRVSSWRRLKWGEWLLSLHARATILVVHVAGLGQPGRLHARATILV